MMKKISLAEKVAFLRDPGSHRPCVEEVEAIETHMAWIFLAGTSAYKLKKPVRFDFLDFSTLALRRDICHREVEINRALAGGVYHGAVPLVHPSDGTLAIDGEGEVVDWLVHMRRLPREKMLDVRIEAHTVIDEEVRSAVAVLCRFYESQQPQEISPDVCRRRIQRAVERNENELRGARYGLPQKTIDAVIDAQRCFLRDEAELLDRRVRDGRIIDGHGDLRPEHICLESKPVIFDRIEFNDEFRILDAADELSYLQLECDLLGAPRIGKLAYETYQELTGDRPPARLNNFYRSLRACVRSLLSARHLDDENADVAKWTGRALSYLELAKSYLSGMRT